MNVGDQIGSRALVALEMVSGAQLLAHLFGVFFDRWLTISANRGKSPLGRGIINGNSAALWVCYTKRSAS